MYLYYISTRTISTLFEYFLFTDWYFTDVTDSLQTTDIYLYSNISVDSTDIVSTVLILST